MSDLAPHRVWGLSAALGYAAAALLARHPRPAVRAALLGAVAVPLALLAATGRGQLEVSVVERSGALLTATGVPYAPEPGGLADYNPYLPGMAVLGALPGDPRWWTGGVLVASLAAAGVAPRVVALVAACPLVALPLAVGGVDLPAAGLMCLGLALAGRGRAGSAGLALGAAAALKWTAWPALPVAVALLAARPHPRSRTRRRTGTGPCPPPTAPHPATYPGWGRAGSPPQGTGGVTGVPCLVTRGRRPRGGEPGGATPPPTGGHRHEAPPRSEPTTGTHPVPLCPPSPKLSASLEQGGPPSPSGTIAHNGWVGWGPQRDDCPQRDRRDDCPQRTGWGAVPVERPSAAGGRRGAARCAAVAVAVAGVLTLPVAACAPAAVYEHVVAFPLGLAGTPSPAASPFPGRLLAAYVPGGTVVAAGLLTVSAVLLAASLVLRPPRTVPEAARRLALGLALATAFMPASRFGYLVHPLVLLVCLKGIPCTVTVRSSSPTTSRPGRAASRRS
ncbi:hypothetical protein [Streptomyces ficellus]|uniref:hypothetical protein n=1 Tax=Streptomyces ficellus TaxID=1977088 RepID=UPI001FCA6C9E|nr:hypothetical protein [Streptomyces ficellus]